MVEEMEYDDVRSYFLVQFPGHAQDLMLGWIGVQVARFFSGFLDEKVQMSIFHFGRTLGQR